MLVEQLDQSLGGAGQGGPPLFWLADPWEVQGVSKLAGEGLRGGVLQALDGCCTQVLIPPHRDQSG